MQIEITTLDQGSTGDKGSAGGIELPDEFFAVKPRAFPSILLVRIGEP